MSYSFFGVVEKIFGEPGHARIRALAKVSPGGDKRDLSFSPEHFGPTRKVFLTGGAYEIGLVAGSAVRFDATENPREPRPGRDDDRFMVENQNHTACIDVDTAALPVVEVEQVDTSKSQLRTAESLLAGRRVYVQWADRFEGPWQVEDDGSTLRPVRGDIYKSKRVFTFPLEFTKSAIYVDDWKSQPPFRGYFLQDIDPHEGIPVDLATGKQLAEWMLKLATRDDELTRALEDLDQRFSGWRKILREVFDELADDIDRAIYRERLQRIEDMLGTLMSNRAVLQEVAKSRPFLHLWEEAVAERRDELEEQARREFEQERDRLDKELLDLKTSVRTLQAERHSYLEEREQSAARVNRLLEHLKREHERLVDDVILIHDIFPSKSPRGRLEDPTIPPATLDGLLAIQPAPSGGVAVRPSSSREFSENSLSSALGYYGLETDGSKLLHAAMLACRASLLPSPVWSRAYATALGSASARFLLIQVEPHWISFQEVWRGGLAAAWKAAIEEPDMLILVHLQDLDRALPEIWLRPVLDLLSGMRDTLPSGEAWPPNLRLVASLAEGEARLPIAETTTLCFAAPIVSATDGPSGIEILATTRPPGQPAGAWTGWQRALPEVGELLPVPRLAEVPTDFRRLAWEDVRQLAAALASLVDRPIEEVVKRAFELRVVSQQLGHADEP